MSQTRVFGALHVDDLFESTVEQLPAAVDNDAAGSDLFESLLLISGAWFSRGARVALIADLRLAV